MASRDFIGNDTVCLILGDNIFYVKDLQEILQQSAKLEKGGLVFGYWMSDSLRYDVVELE